MTILDDLGLGVQVAAWVYFPNLKDWRFYVATPLVDEMGRRKVYSLLADALDVMGPPDRMTVFDLHVEGCGEGLAAMMATLFHIDNATVEFTNCSFNGIPVDAVAYRILTGSAALQYPKKAAKDFERKVRRVLAGT